MKRIIGLFFAFVFVFNIQDTHAVKRKLDEITGGSQERDAKRVKTISYSFNLMWINAKLNKDQEYIYPAKEKEDLFTKFFEPIFAWAKTSDTARSINIWYDGDLISEQAVKNTEHEFHLYVIKNPPKKMAPVRWRDIRLIDRVKKDKDVFSVQSNVYFRVDLLRPIIALDLLGYYGREPEVDFFVYGDLDMEPLPETALFDEDTLTTLSEYGMVMAESDVAPYGFENGFQVIGRNNKNLFMAIDFAVIELNVKRFYNMDEKHPEVKFEAEVVFLSYVDMFKYFYALEGKGKLYIENVYEGKEPQSVMYDKEKHGLEPFGVWNTEKYRLILSDMHESIKPDVADDDIEAIKNNQIMIPVKAYFIELPDSEGLYEGEFLRYRDCDKSRDESKSK